MNPPEKEISVVQADTEYSNLDTESTIECYIRVSSPNEGWRKSLKESSPRIREFGLDTE